MGSRTDFHSLYVGQKLFKAIGETMEEAYALLSVDQENRDADTRYLIRVERCKATSEQLRLQVRPVVTNLLFSRPGKGGEIFSSQHGRTESPDPFVDIVLSESLDCGAEPLVGEFDHGGSNPGPRCEKL